MSSLSPRSIALQGLAAPVAALIISVQGLLPVSEVQPTPPEPEQMYGGGTGSEGIRSRQRRQVEVAVLSFLIAQHWR